MQPRARNSNFQLQRRPIAVTFPYLVSLTRVIQSIKVDLIDRFGGQVPCVAKCDPRHYKEPQMKSVILSPLLSKTRPTESWTRLNVFANGRVAVTLSSLFLGSLVASLAMADAAPLTRAPLYPEAMAMHVQAKRSVAEPATTLEPATALVASSSFNSAQGPGPGAIGPGPGCDLFPAPPSVGASVPLTYFGPSPSETNPSLVGPVQLLKSGTVDTAHGTITLPLYLGHMKGSKKNVWYILTDVDDPNVAAELGLNFSAKLTFASNAART